jgi:monothiol glutaredoxin
LRRLAAAWSHILRCARPSIDIRRWLTTSFTFQRLAAALLRKTKMSDAQAVQDWIRKTIASNDVVLFMKGTKQFPQCGFSAQVAKILDHLGVPYKDVNVLEDMGVREGIKAFANWPTIPQLYVKGEFVGGCDIVREMFQEGELHSLIHDKGIAHTSHA